MTEGGAGMTGGGRSWEWWGVVGMEGKGRELWRGVGLYNTGDGCYRPSVCS